MLAVAPGSGADSRTRHGSSLLLSLFALRSQIGAQPQRYVRGLHSLSHHPRQVIGQGVQVRLVTQSRVEGGERLCGVVLVAVEATVNEALEASSERNDEGSDHQGGSHNHE